MLILCESENPPHNMCYARQAWKLPYARDLTGGLLYQMEWTRFGTVLWAIGDCLYDVTHRPFLFCIVKNFQLETNHKAPSLSPGFSRCKLIHIFGFIYIHLLVLNYFKAIASLFHLIQKYLNSRVASEAGEMGGRLKVLAALTEDLGLIPSGSYLSVTAGPGDQAPSSVCHRHCMHVAHR